MIFYFLYFAGFPSEAASAAGWSRTWFQIQMFCIRWVAVKVCCCGRVGPLHYFRCPLHRATEWYVTMSLVWALPQFLPFLQTTGDCVIERRQCLDINLCGLHLTGSSEREDADAVGSDENTNTVKPSSYGHHGRKTVLYLTNIHLWSLALQKETLFSLLKFHLGVCLEFTFELNLL